MPEQILEWKVRSSKMKGSYIGRSLLLGVFTSVILIVLALGITQLTGLVYPPFRLFDFVSRLLPGAVITVVIDTMVRVITSLNLGPTSEVAKLVEQGMALVQFMVIGGLFGVGLGFFGSKTGYRRTPLWGSLIGLVLAFGFVLIEMRLASAEGTSLPNLLWLTLLFGLWGQSLGWLIRGSVQAARASSDESKLSRREALYLGGTALGALALSAIGLGFLLYNRETEEGIPVTGPTPPPDDRLANRIEPAPGTRPEVTSNQNFYRIDINTIPPNVNADEWRLELGGLVKNPMTLTLDQIRSRPSISQYITLECISNQIGGDLISASKWTGLRLIDLLDEAGLQPGAQELSIESVDGFYESVSMQDMLDERTFLVYEMNDEPLPVEHGFPLRIYIPNHFGMKQPKWITRMEVIDHEGAGYWVDRGWSEEAIVKTTSVIDNVEVETGGGEMMLSGGIAYAGARGISKVELQVDDGPWNEVALRNPPISPLMWVQWRYESPVQPGNHVARVRAYDGNGNLQILEESPPHPNGATGIHTFDFSV
jgi:DMSO/TMAO reductase YedYZ molybdopterin-dependent catalytic subunit